MECPRCQHTLRDTARFCDGCGLSIGSLEQATRELDGLAATEPADALLGKIVDRKYRVTEALGRGGMGVVYRATRVNIGDEVALKVLRREFVAEPETVQRFRREAKAAAMLRHPNIVVIHDYGEAGADGNADAPAYIVMELVSGASLGDIVRVEKRLDVERAVRLMRGICAGVGAAHRRDIVHRDLKPDNVIVLPPDEEEDREHETVKVVDFGIANLRDPAGGGTLTQKGFQPGTVFYMSPEQCRGDELDARSDVYSLGAMFYEMIAGRPPFVAETRTGVITRHLTESPPAFTAELNVSPELEAVVRRALAKDASDRQATTTVLGRELLEAERQELEAARSRAGEAAEKAREEEQRRAGEENLRVASTVAAPTVSSRDPKVINQAENYQTRRSAEDDSSLPKTVSAETPKDATAGAPDASGSVPTQKLNPHIPLNIINNVAPLADSRGSADQTFTTETTGKNRLPLIIGGIVVLCITVGAAIYALRGTTTPATSGASNVANIATTTRTQTNAANVAGNNAATNFRTLTTIRTARDRFKLAISPAGDWIVSNASGTVRLERVTGQGSAQTVNITANVVASSIAVSPDGQTVVAGSEDGTIYLWRTSDGSLVSSTRAHSDYIFLIAFSADGGAIMSAAGDKTVRLSSASTLQQTGSARLTAEQLLITLDATKRQYAALNAKDKSVTVRSLDGGGTNVSIANRSDISSGAFSPDGETLALGAADGSVKLWSIPDGTFIREHKGATGEVGSIAFSADNRLLAIGWANGDIELRRTSDGNSLQTLKGHTKIVRTLSFSRDGGTLASGAEDSTIRLWKKGEK